MLDGTLDRVDEQVMAFLGRAATMGRIGRNLFQGGRLSHDDPEHIAGFFSDVLDELTEIDTLSFTFEEDGEPILAHRLEDGRLAVAEERIGPGSVRERREFEVNEEGGLVVGSVSPDPVDSRTRAHYRIAADAGRQMWTETSILRAGEDDDSPPEPGISCSTPVHDAQGGLLGVLSADFHTVRVSRFLDSVFVSETGFAFVVERQEGELHVVAHPEQETIVTLSGETLFLRDGADHEDGRVRRFLSLVPETLVPGQMTSISFFLGGEEYLGACQLHETEGLPSWIVCCIIPEDDVTRGVKRMQDIVLRTGAGSVLLAVLLTLWVSHRIARPLVHAAGEAIRIGRLEVEPRPMPGTRIRELSRLVRSVEEMKTSLRSFRKYVPADLVRRLLSSGKEARLGGQSERLTVLFADIVGFTRIAEGLSPDEVARLLDRYLGPVSEEILEAGGTVDKYIGDAVMAFFGAPEPQSDHALRCCRAALTAQSILGRLRDGAVRIGGPRVQMRIGINTGKVVVGNMGCEARLDYTVMGDSVNVASRLESLNSAYGTPILLGEETLSEVGSTVEVRLVDRVSVKGREAGLAVYELLGLKGEVDNERLEAMRLYERGLDHYFAGRWEEAASVFEEVLTLVHDDGPARVMRDRCRELLAGPRDEGRDGVHRMTVK